MNPELQQLIEALDMPRSCSSARTEESAQLKATYEVHLQDLLTRHPNVSRESLESVIERAYLRWLGAQNKPSAMPPEA